MPRWLCHWMVWLRGADLPLGYAGFFDGNGGMRVAWAWRLCQTCLTCLTCLTILVRHCIPRGFAVPLSVLARGGKELPLG